MLVNKLYYLLKPLLPWNVRLALRRQRARRRRADFADVWPIDERAGMPPPVWPGWPEGKRFAFILTHDVEASRGLQRVKPLMELELKYDFRSSFNFVPERDYRVSDELRQEMDLAGFEVALHGLKHDGKLYSSRAEFQRRAARIRDYIERWKACGFRSPFMQHELGWLHLLGVEYDASTFDTDPFEPQPDAAGTIFPFWVPGPNGTGYVELPYTLVQDFTLFTVLRERNIDIWKRKIDWLAERGGMALLNTHPDYMHFGEGQAGRDEFRVSHYEELLSYLREKYDGQFWHALPRDVARYYTDSVPRQSRRSRKKICMVTYSSYESDSRVRRCAETLVKRGDEVDVISISSGNVPMGEETILGVKAHRIQRRELNERSKWTYAWRLLRFLASSSLKLKNLHDEKRYDLIYVHNMPDFLVFGAWYPKLRGAKVVLDVHDLVPELFADKFHTGGNSFLGRALKTQEKASANFADHVIISNHLWQKTLTSRCISEAKCSVYLNHIDPTVFYRRARNRNDDKFILVFPGTWQWHQGLDVAIRAIGHLRETIPNIELHLYGGGTGGIEKELFELVDELNLRDHVKFCGFIPMEDVPAVIANADVGVVPKRADSFGNEAYSTKIMEFMSQGVPVVASRTAIDSFYFDDTLIRFFPSGDSQALAAAIADVKDDTSLRHTLIENGLEYARANDWGHRKDSYLELLDSLMTEHFEETDNSLIMATKSRRA